ncbi:hypothetical protein HDU76_005661 [Blyttiomyces sp. JEL0837]|nr:hypothetical protein HDU76_005661 [Blyttiomyces sp. JEL0837]
MTPPSTPSSTARSFASSYLLPPSTKQRSYSLWDALPIEIIDQIIHSSDILTRCLQKDLTEDQIEDYATEIWLEAFREDWSGDLSLLPSSGLPTTRTGLCLVHSQSMLQRLRTLHPDLDINRAGQLQDTFRVLIKDNTNYGCFMTKSEAPVVYLNEFDVIKPGGSTVFGYISQAEVIGMISPALINISMRHCFIDDLQPYISDYPISIAAMAIELDHFDLLKYLVDEIKSVDLSTFPVLETKPEKRLEPYYAAVKNNNLQMQEFLLCLVKHEQLDFIKFAYEIGMFSEIEFRRLVPNSAPLVSNLDIWEWLLDTIYGNRFGLCRVIPIANDIRSARRIISKLGDIKNSILSANARMGCSIDAFRELWYHRDQSMVFQFQSHIDQTNIEEVKIFLMNLRQYTPHYQCSADAFRHAHLYINSTNNTNIPNCSKDIISYTIRNRDDIILLKAINEVCHCPNVVFTTEHVDEAAELGNFNMVKYLLENTTVDCSQHKFYLCARKGYLDIVQYLWNRQSEKCHVDLGLLNAMESGHLGLVKFMKSLGGVVIPQIFEKCVKKGYIHVVKYLCENGNRKCTPSLMLEFAMESKSLRMVRFVRELFPEME